LWITGAAMAKKKLKAPAYQYYPDDFDQGTATYTLAEVGAYQRLLNYQWTRGSVPGADLEALSRILRTNVDETRTVLETVLEKFEQRKGVFQNCRMEKERKKQRAFARKQAENGQKGGRPRGNPKRTQTKPKPKPKPKAKKSSPSPPVGSVRTPPNPLAREGGRITRAERALAEENLQKFRDKQPHYVPPVQRDPAREYPDPKRCPHDPPACPDDLVCVDRLALERRQRLAEAS
jgi:uncharacterized protein YdaU (DUF1376 family)